ncbi:MAG: DNA polymerase III subunit alpha [Candidatus Omnitrophica bacterium]|jgi:DNA polymerase-3 subunit alpha|nr:DNA polymerase III subunit alpha [Candidatus Omnitrophota bacterium]
MKEFVHLHLHSEYSLLDGMCRIDKITEECHKMEMPSLAITDHGTLFGIIHFYQSALNHGIKPIIGEEMYIAPKSRLDKSSAKLSDSDVKEASFHLTVLTQDLDGYKNLLELSTLSYLEGFYHKPRIDREILSKYSKGLIVLSGCMKGEIPYYIVKGNIEKAEQAVQNYIDIIGKENFYLEVMDNNLPEQKKINQTLLEFSKKYSLKVVATNDCHYHRKEDAFAHEVFLCIQTGNSLQDENRLKFSGDEFYFKSPDEMQQIFKDMPSAIKNTIEIDEKCHLKLDFGTFHIPTYNIPQGYTTDTYLDKIVYQNLKEKFSLNGEEQNSISERLKKEMEVIKKMNFSGYFLIIHDIVSHAKNQDIKVGPGRGSCGGSLVAYLLGITEINPIGYNLLFERFLNPERISMPDIDLDFSDRRRDEVIKYIREKYGGETNVAQIATFGTMGARVVVRDVGRVLKMPYSEVDKIAKMISSEPGVLLKEEMDKNSELKKLIETNETIKKLFDISLRLEGLPRHASTHAAGVVITDKPIYEYAPLFRGTKGETATQFEMSSIEKIGLLKIDILGLKNLSVIEDTVQLVKQNKKIDIDILKIPLDDKKTYELLSTGESKGVFQLESPGMQDLLKRMKPSSLEDIIAINALHRPGPMKSGMVDLYIKNRQNTSEITYQHPLLENILKPTYGVILYQEQVMQIANVLGGFTLGEADILRKAMGKKNPELLEQQREKFIKGAKENGLSSKLAEKIFDNMAKFASYGFNKSHSVGYAILAYQTAYLKANYPLEFMTALLNNEIGNQEKISLYIQDAEKTNIWVLPPDINESGDKFTIMGNDIVFGLSAIKNVGSAAIQSILLSKKEKKFENIFDFCQNVDLRLINRKVLESFIKAGAMDCFGMPRSQLFALVDESIEQGSKIQKIKEDGQLSIFAKTEKYMPPVNHKVIYSLPEWSETKLLGYEKEMLGVYRTGHPLAKYKNILLKYTTAYSNQIETLKEGPEFWFGGLILSLKKMNTKKGEKMAVAELEDLYGIMGIVFYPKVFESNISLLSPNNIILIKGKIEHRMDENKVIATAVKSFDMLIEKKTENLAISIIQGYPEENMEILKSLFMKFSGDSKIFLRIKENGNTLAKVYLPKYHVNISPEFLDELKKIVSTEQIEVI